MANMKKYSSGDYFTKQSLSDRIFGAAVILLSILIFIIIVYPLWFVVIASVSNSNLVNQGLVTLWPKDIRFYGFEQVFEDSRQKQSSSILMTCEPDSPLIPLCTYAVCTNDTNLVYHNVDLNSRLGILMIIQILIELIVQKKLR